MATNYYDGSLKKDETKQYKLIKKVSDNGTLFLYYKSIEIDKEKEDGLFDSFYVSTEFTIK